MAHRQNLTIRSLFYWYYFGISSPEFSELITLLILDEGPFVILIGCVIFLLPFLDVLNISVSILSFHPQLDTETCLQSVVL